MHATPIDPHPFPDSIPRLFSRRLMVACQRRAWCQLPWRRGEEEGIWGSWWGVAWYRGAWRRRSSRVQQPWGSVCSVISIQCGDSRADITYVDGPETGSMSGGHILVHGLNCIGSWHLTVLLVHVVGAGAGVISDPDTEVLDLQWTLLVDLRDVSRESVLLQKSYEYAPRSS